MSDLGLDVEMTCNMFGVFFQLNVDDESTMYNKWNMFYTFVFIVYAYWLHERETVFFLNFNVS